MRHPFFRDARPLVFAHRGGAALAPENTIDAFANALATGVDGLELDVRVSRDGHVVVHHDATLDRTTRMSGPVDRRDAAELIAGGVPRLDAVLRLFPTTRVIVDVKIDSERFGRLVASVVREAGAIDRVCIGGFGRRALSTIRRVEPSLATSAAREEVRWALYRSWVRWPLRRPAYDGFQVPEQSGRTRVVSPRFIQHAHAAGLAVQVWTVDDEAQARRLLEWGVGALITDRPDLMVPLVRQFSAYSPSG